MGGQLKDVGGLSKEQAQQAKLQQAQLQIQQGLSAMNGQAAQAAKLQEADLQQKIAKGISDAAAEMNQQLNEAISAMAQPIYDAITQFKGVPPKLRKLVDVQGAANGMYSQLGKLVDKCSQLSSIMISSEVPITLFDYKVSPSKYANLQALEYRKNEITEEDCLSSGYTTIKWEIDENWWESLKEQMPLPQDRDVVGKQMEKLVGSAIKQGWQTLQPPIKTVASIANIGPLPEMVQGMIDAIDGIVKVASMRISEEDLNKMIAQKQLAQEQAAAEAAKAQKPDSPDKTDADKAEQATAAAKSKIAQAYDGVKAGIAASFENFQAPSIPDDVKETIEDFKDAVIMVKDNITNIYIVVILKMLECVFKCFKKIVGVIGVPQIPDPLGKIPQLAMDAVNVMQFVMGLPMSLIQCLIAIVKRKIKAVMIAMTPAPPLPIPEIVPVPPTSQDVAAPQTSWDDVKAFLQEKYAFAESDAGDVVAALQEFYDGSGDEVDVVVRVETSRSEVKKGQFDDLPVFERQERYRMEPEYCKTTWIPSHVDKTESVGEGYYFYLSPPVKVSDTDWAGKFHRWATEDEDIKYNHDMDWSVLKSYQSGLNQYYEADAGSAQ